MGDGGLHQVCELIGGGSSRYLKPFSNWFIDAVHISTHAMYCCNC